MSSHEIPLGQYGTTLLKGQHSNYHGQVSPQQNEHLAFYASNHSISPGVDLKDHLDHFNSEQDQSQESADLSSRPSTPNNFHIKNEPVDAIPTDIEENLTESEPLNSQKRNSHGLFFSSFSEGYSAIPLPDWPLNPYDATMPRTDEDSRQWVLKLLHALNNIENVHDKPSASFKKNWFDLVKGPSTIYSAIAKEELCWEIFKRAEDLHRKGPRTLECFNHIFWINAVKTRGWTFQQRMEKIIEVVKYSKARCSKMLKSNDLIKGVVANPENVLKMSLGNAKQNSARQALLAAGRAMKRGKAKADTANEIKTEPTV